MECQTCHAAIADKAIVCYRCGAPTASTAAATAARRTQRAIWVVPAIGAAALVLGVVAWDMPPGSMVRIGAAAAALFVAAVALLLARRR